MNKLILALALSAGFLFTASEATAQVVGGVGVQIGRGGVNLQIGTYNYGRYPYGYPGYGTGIYVGPRYRYPTPYPYPAPYPRPYPNPYPNPAPITVLVTDYCHGRLQTYYVVAQWDRMRGGWWYYDCNRIYRRAR